MTGVLCPPGSATSYRDLPEAESIGGYPRPGQLDGAVDEATLDSEGRCVVLEFPAFVLLGVYSPASRDASRDDFRMGFLEALDARVRNLVAAGKRVVLAGDLNVIRDPRDTAGFADAQAKGLTTYREFLDMPSRRLFNHLLKDGIVYPPRDEGRGPPIAWDMCRLFHPDRKGMYTCWETKKNARPGNFGSRIDYIVVSDELTRAFVTADIQEGLLGSDHCPVYATLRDMVDVGDREVHVEDALNPPGMFLDGVRLREWSAKDLLPLSARLIPDFDRRRSIKDMFFKKGGPPAAVAAASAEASDFPSWSKGEASGVDTSAEEPDTNTPPRRDSKRAAGPSLSPYERQKRAKSARERGGAGSGLSQSSLTGFFKPAAAAKPGPVAEAGKTPDVVDLRSPGTDETSQVTDQTSQVTDQTLDAVDLLDVVDLRSPMGDQVLDVVDRRSPVADQALDMVDRRSPTADQSSDAVDLLSVVDLRSPSVADLRSSSVAETTGEPASEDGRVFDPIENKEAWSKLLGKRVAPRCEHGEPCISYVTKKPGVNCGESLLPPVRRSALTRSREVVLHLRETARSVGRKGARH